MAGRALLSALFWLLAGTAQSAVATFQGEALEDLTGLRTDRLEVAAYRDGELRSVRHQWLAWSQRGWPYFSEDDDSRRAGETGRVGPRDRLLVDHADGGERLPSPGQEVIGELALDSDGERPVYFYVLARPPFQGFTPPVTLERDDDGDPLSLRTADYRLEFLDGNLFQWGDFTYRHYRAPDDKPQRTLLDSLKLRLSAGVFSEGARLTLTNENLDPQIQQVIEGPLATLVYATTRVRVAGLRGQQRADVTNLSDDGLTPTEQLQKISDAVLWRSTFVEPSPAAAKARSSLSAACRIRLRLKHPITI